MFTRRWTEEDLAKIKAACLAGMTYEEIYELFPDRSPHGVKFQLHNKLKLRAKRSNVNKPWSAAEDRIFLENYKSMTRNQLAEFMGKSKRGIQRKAGKLGVTFLIRDGGGKHLGKVFRMWNKTEKNKLYYYAGTMSVPKLAKKLGRTYDSVCFMACRMGIDLAQGTYSLHAVAKLLHISIAAVARHRDRLGQTWATVNHVDNCIEPGATPEQVTELAKAILAEKNVCVMASKNHLTRIASGDWDEDPLFAQEMGKYEKGLPAEKESAEAA